MAPKRKKKGPKNDKSIDAIQDESTSRILEWCSKVPELKRSERKREQPPPVPKSTQGSRKRKHSIADDNTSDVSEAVRSQTGISQSSLSSFSASVRQRVRIVDNGEVCWHCSAVQTDICHVIGHRDTRFTELVAHGLICFTQLSHVDNAIHLCPNCHRNVVARLPDRTWSAPSAIGLGGAGFGGQIGFELTDFVFVLNDAAAVRAFSEQGSLTLDGNVSLAAGPLGRNAEAGLKGVAGVFSFSFEQHCGLQSSVNTQAERNKALLKDICLNIYCLASK